MKPDARYPNEKFRHLAVQKFGTPKCNRTFNVQKFRHRSNFRPHRLKIWPASKFLCVKGWLYGCVVAQLVDAGSLPLRTLRTRLGEAILYLLKYCSAHKKIVKPLTKVKINTLMSKIFTQLQKLRVVIEATWIGNQTERSKNFLDQSESRISPMWPNWRHKCPYMVMVVHVTPWDNEHTHTRVESTFFT